MVPPGDARRKRLDEPVEERVYGANARTSVRSGSRDHAGPGLRGMMTKRSRNEREQRATESVRMVEVQRAWEASIPASVASEFARGVEAARARGPLPKPPDMAPGTAPRPPRPGREPKVKEEATPRRRY
jgi:hypothetical protein